MTNNRYSNFRGAKVEKVLRIEVNEGDGTTGDPITRVVYWVDFEGNIIGHNDQEDRLFRGGKD
jgi:hypothetical protein